MDYNEASKQLRAKANEFAAQMSAIHLREYGLEGNISFMLQLAWCDAVRDRFDAIMSHPELKRQHAVAVQLMQAEHSRDDDLICMPIGAKPTIIKVDGHECVCFDVSMTYGVPLSAIYMNKAKEAIDLVASLPVAPFPITAGGQTYNSLDELLQSKDQKLRGLAEALSNHNAQRDKLVAEILIAAPEQTDGSEPTADAGAGRGLYEGPFPHRNT